MKAVLVGALGISMAGAPVLAQTADAAVAATYQDGDSAETRDYLLPALVLIAVLAAAILLTGSDDRQTDSP